MTGGEAGEFPWSMLGEKAIFDVINLNSNIFKGYSMLDSSFFERACEILKNNCGLTKAQ